VLDGVDQGLFERQANAEDVLLAELMGLERLLDLLLDASGLTGVAGARGLGRTFQAGVGRGLHPARSR